MYGSMENIGYGCIMTSIDACVFKNYHCWKLWFHNHASNTGGTVSGEVETDEGMKVAEAALKTINSGLPSMHSWTSKGEDTEKEPKERKPRKDKNPGSSSTPKVKRSPGPTYLFVLFLAGGRTPCSGISWPSFVFPAWLELRKTPKQEKAKALEWSTLLAEFAKDCNDYSSKLKDPMLQSSHRPQIWNLFNIGNTYEWICFWQFHPQPSG